ATHPRIPGLIIVPEHLPEKPNGEHGGRVGLPCVSHDGNIAQPRRRQPSHPASEGRVSERLAALRAAELLGDAFKELQEPVAALAAPVPAVGLRDGQVHDAQLLASLAEGQPAPVARAACLSPSERKSAAGEGARCTPVLDDGSHRSPYRGCRQSSATPTTGPSSIAHKQENDPLVYGSDRLRNSLTVLWRHWAAIVRRAPHGRNDAAIDRSLSLVSTRPANGPPSGTSRASPSRPGGSTGTAGSSDCPRHPRDTRAGPGSAGRGRTVRRPWGSPSVVFRFA